MSHFYDDRPGMGWVRTIRANRLKADIPAGVTTAAVVIPQAMAYATIAGLPVQVGLGTTLVLTSGAGGSLSTWLASAWAILGGIVLVSDALYIRRRLTRVEPISPE